MPINIRPIEESENRWERRTSAAADDYLAGSLNPRRSWAETALAGESNYKTQVVQAANAGAYGAGIRKAGDAKHRRQIERKGKANYQTGVAGAGTDWGTGIRPYLAAMSKVVLPPRGAKNSQANYERSRIVGDTNNKLKTQLRQQRG